MKARKFARTRRCAPNLGIQSSPARNTPVRSVPWNDRGEGLCAGFRLHGSTDRAKMTVDERKMLRAWDNTGGTGETVEWKNGHTCRRRMPAKEVSEKWDGRTHDVGPIQPAIVELEAKRISYTDAVQHGIVTED